MYPSSSSEEDISSRNLLWSLLRELVETVLPAILIAVFITLFLAQATQIYGQSMEPNLHAGQRLIVEKVSYRFHPPHRGDIVVLRLPSQSNFLIKRVVGLPGETIEIRDHQVLINGQPLNESYLSRPSRRSIPPRHIPEGSVFVLGDNRNFSNDSRSFGPVSLSNVVGRAWIRYWPPDQVGLVR
ncbi:MAG: signal peptidase I [Chloroflexota bacterium]|nr:signal peptidase I [Chloroflexota bacterium]